MNDIITIRLTDDQQKQLQPFVNTNYQFNLKDAPNAPATIFMVVDRIGVNIQLQAAALKWSEAKEVINCIRKFKGVPLIPVDKKKRVKKQ